MMKLKILPFALAALAILSIAAVVGVTTVFSQNNSPVVNDRSYNGSGPSMSPDLARFNSTDEILSYLKQSTVSDREYYDTYGVDEAVGIAAAPAAASYIGSVGGKITGTVSGNVAPAGYSTTNVQVAGVDEPDFVKNDGKYIYVISGNKLEIIDAYPPDGANIVSVTDVIGSPTNLFVNGDQIVVFSTAYDNMPVPLATDSTIQGASKTSAMPAYTSTPVTHALVYSISDRSQPRLEKDLKVDGNYFDARMIGDWVYMITTEQVNYYGPIVVPAIYAGQEKIAQPDVYYFRNQEPSYVFHTVTAFNANGGKDVQSKTFLMGYTNNLYVSENNIYISYQSYRSAYSQPVEMTDSSISFSQREDAFNNMSEADKQSYINGLNGGDSYTDTTQTVIHKIAIHDGAIDYVAKGEVGGTLLNQFSMDENDGMLRVATTSYGYTPSGSQQYNSVYILDNGMHTTGSLKGIAPNEKIYSARFIGSRLYLVTYRNIDPLFVIDLSSVNKPKILGELKITGYSNFLYPYDATHIIGIGRETKDNSWGGVSNSGIKVAMFDVSDVNDPKLVDKYQIGDAQAYSEALNEHKALLLDPAKGIMVIPISQVTVTPVIKDGSSYMQGQTWNGAYVFGLSRNGFKVKGTVTQDYAPRRSLYIGNDLYTISTQNVVISDLGDLSRPVGEIDLTGYSEAYTAQPISIVSYPPQYGWE